MKKKKGSESGLFNPRTFFAFFLCSLGVSLAVMSLAAPNTPRRGSRSAATPGTLQPIVKMSVPHVSDAIRDLPSALPTGRRLEHELPPVKPTREIPPSFVDQVVQTAMRGTHGREDAARALAMPGTNITFEGMNQAEGCGGCIPPDTTGAVGRTQYVQMVNSAFSVYKKDGTRLTGPTPINQLFKTLPEGNVCRETNNGDPVVVYDQLADRWLLSQFAFNFDDAGAPTGPWYECIAISQTPDAAGPYYLYDFHLSDTKFHDYPHIGLWPDAYYMATHEFQSPNFNYVGAAAVAFERDKMLAGQPAQMVLFDLGTLPAPFNTAYGGHLPANLDGYTLPPAGAPNYFVQTDTATELPPSAALRIWKFHVDWANPANSTFGVNSQPNSVVPIANFARPPCSLAGQRVYVAGCVPQLGDPSQLDPIGDRLMYRLAYRNFGGHESLVLNHTVVANATPPEQMGPRWYEVRDPGGTPTIFQQSTFGPTGVTDVLSRFMGSIAMDNGGNIAIGYSTSSSASFPSIAYAGRLAGDPVNTLAQGEAVMTAGLGPQHGEAFAPQTGRWGDYTTMTVDPADDCTFWFTNEYYGDPAGPTANWQTRVGSFKFPQCVAVVPPPGTPVMNPFSSDVVSESCSPPFNGVIDPGETVSVSLCITNTGSANAANVVGTLAATGGVTNPGPPQSYGGVVAQGAAVCKTFTFTAANQACGSQITASLQLQAGPVNIGTVNYNFTLGAPIAPLNEDFDGVIAPAVPAGWIATNAPGSASVTMWQTSTSNPSSPPNSAFVDDPDTRSDKTLDSPAFMITSAAAKLTFDHDYNLEDGFDGGVLEIKIGSGAFQDWEAAGGTFTANGYSGMISTAPQNLSPIVGRKAWTGGSGGYVTTVASFPAAAVGQTVQLRFRMGSDSIFGGRGWYVDDVVVSEGFTCCNAAPITVSSRKIHGNEGPFDVNLPLTGTPGIECRRDGEPGDHDIVFTFGAPVTFASATCDGSPATTSTTGNEVTVHCTGIANAQTIPISLLDVNDGTGTGDVSVLMSVLAGDSSSDGSVNSADISQVKSQSGQALTDSPPTPNFREDLNIDGFINSGDISLVKSKSGTALP